MAGALGCGMPARVLITTDAVGGVWRYSVSLASGFAELGAGCVLAVLGPAPSAAQRSEVAGLANVTLVASGLPLDWTAPDEAALANASSWLRDAATKFDVSAVHLHTPALAAFDWRGPVMGRVVAVAHSCVGTWWDAVCPDQAAPADFQWRMQLMARGLARASVTIAPSAAFADALRRVYRTDAPIDVIRNGLPMPGKTPPVRRELRVLTAGRLWDRGKNVSVLDAAAESLDAPIDAAGPVAGADGSLFKAKRLNLLGDLSAQALVEAIGRTSVFAAPSLYEPFGLAVLEAAQRATPLVLADIPTFRELWSDAALFVPPNEPAAWADALRGVLAAPARREALGARAWARAQLYDAANMVAATASVHRAAYAAGRVGAAA